MVVFYTCRRACVIVLALAATTVQAAAADVDPQTAADVRKVIEALDSDSFSKRDQAARKLDELVNKPELGTYLADQFGRLLLAPGTSFEVRARLERCLQRLPSVAVEAPAPNATTPQIGPLLDQLNSDQSTRRDTAERQLEAMLDRVEFVAPILVQAKQRLADPAVGLQVRRSLEAVLDKARQVWVNSDSNDVVLPPVSSEQINTWLDDIVLAEPLDGASRVRRETARRELIDLLVRDDTRPRLVELLNQRQAAAEDAETEAAYAKLTEFAKPAMAAEVWGYALDLDTNQVDRQRRQHRTVQYLIVGVAQRPEGAPNATHFDRCDDQTAHCVSGNSLNPGDYPVGIAIPHPIPGQDVMFYLVNLPTPKRRLAYDYSLRRDEHDRLREISERTLNDILAKRQVLDEQHVMLLMLLDPGAVSRFAGPYFKAVADRPLSAMTGGLSGQFTLHTAVCAALILVGTHEAIPAIDKLARSGKLQKPSYENPLDIAWIAALSIARRDPWPGVDDWLAGLIDETKPLIINADPVPDLGGSAAGLLLERHDMSHDAFDLEPAGNNAFERANFAGYRFTSDEDRAAVRQWWAEQKQAELKKSSP